MKAVLFGAVAVVVGLAMGSWAGGMKQKGALMAVLADSIAQADSLAALARAAERAQPTPGASHEDEAKPASTAPPPASDATFASEDGSGEEGDADHTAGEPADTDPPSEGAMEGGSDADEPLAAGPAQDPSLNPMAQPGTQTASADSVAAAELLRTEGARKLSRIFSVMDARDAANVLQQLGNDEIETILRHMSERNAAPILELFDPERAAALSRVLLSGGAR